MIYSNGRAVNNNWTTCSCRDPEGVGGPDSLSLEKSFLLHSDSKITSTENRLQIPPLKKRYSLNPPQEFFGSGSAVHAAKTSISITSIIDTLTFFSFETILNQIIPL